MNIHALALATGTVAIFASTSVANIVGSTYDFFASAIGATEIGRLSNMARSFWRVIYRAWR